LRTVCRHVAAVATGPARADPGVYEMGGLLPDARARWRRERKKRDEGARDLQLPGYGDP